MDIKKVSAVQTTNKIAFKARFSKDDIKTLIKEATPKGYGDSRTLRIEIPKLYTALKFLDENHPDKMLHLSTSAYRDPQKNIVMEHGEYPCYNTFTQIFNERGNELVSIDGDNNFLGALYGLCRLDCSIGYGRSYKRYLRMPFSVFENEWWKNRNVTIEDVEKLAFDYNA